MVIRQEIMKDFNPTFNIALKMTMIYAKAIQANNSYSIILALYKIDLDEGL